MLSVRFVDTRLMYPREYFNTSLYLTLAFGPQRYSTSSLCFKGVPFHWEDSMKFTKSSEETLTIECFCKNTRNEVVKVGSALIPIQIAVKSGYFRGNVSLMALGKVVLHVVVELGFEEKFEIPFNYPTVIYPLPPPELPHVHAYAVPSNFTYTPPAYYQAKHGEDLVFN